MMGNKPTRQTKTQKDTIKQFKQNEVIRVSENLNQLQTSVLYKPGAITTKVDQQVLAATLVAQNQLHKGGSTFSKDDMVAIAVFIRTASTGYNMFTDNQFSLLTREDLVTLIRTTVFDPDEIRKLAAKSERAAANSLLKIA